MSGKNWSGGEYQETDLVETYSMSTKSRLVISRNYEHITSLFLITNHTIDPIDK